MVSQPPALVAARKTDFVPVSGSKKRDRDRVSFEILADGTGNGDAPGQVFRASHRVADGEVLIADLDPNEPAGRAHIQCADNLVVECGIQRQSEFRERHRDQILSRIDLDSDSSAWWRSPDVIHWTPLSAAPET